MGGYSFKPGRGPSAFGAVGGVIAALFGVLWTVFAINLTADAPFPIVRVIFPLFGVLFVIAAIAGAVYNARNAAGRNRFSEFDVVPTDSEPDPLAPAKGRPVPGEALADKYCPQCGAGLRADDKFCSRCGARAAAGG